MGGGPALTLEKVSVLSLLLGCLLNVRQVQLWDGTVRSFCARTVLIRIEERICVQSDCLAWDDQGCCLAAAWCAPTRRNKLATASLPAVDLAARLKQ